MKETLKKEQQGFSLFLGTYCHENGIELVTRVPIHCNVIASETHKVV